MNERNIQITNLEAIQLLHFLQYKLKILRETIKEADEYILRYGKETFTSAYGDSYPNVAMKFHNSEFQYLESFINIARQIGLSEDDINKIHKGDVI